MKIGDCDINFKKRTLLAYILIYMSTVSFAQDIMTIHLHSGEVSNFWVREVDRLNFNYYKTRVLKVSTNNGLNSEFDISNIDSLTFGGVNFLQKKGFVVIRVDDNHLSGEIIPMSRVLDKYGYKMVNCVNPSIASKDEINSFRHLQLNGHEITDHTPNHTTAYADLLTEAQKSLFIGMPGVEKIVGLRVYFDWIYPDLSTCIVDSDSISINAGSGYIYGDLSKITPQDQVFTQEYGWILLKEITANKAKAIHAKSRQELIFTRQSKEQLYKVDCYSVTLSVDAMRALMLASELVFQSLGVDYFKYWCMCGGSWAMGKGEVIKNASKTTGYLGGSEHSYPNGNIPLMFNQNNPLSRWASNVSTIVAESYDSNQTKRIIANEIAKHRGVVITSHMWYKNPSYTLFTGSISEKFDQYLNSLDDILQFCYANYIPVLTYKDVLKALYETIPSEKVNVIPPLYSDLTSQGYPDGYFLYTNTLLDSTAGVSQDKGFSLKRNENGNLFKIEYIGGFEKGENVFSFYAKGADGVVLQLQLINTAQNSICQTINVPIIGAEKEYVKFNAKLNVPFDTDIFSVKLILMNNKKGQEFYISGMYIGKISGI